MITIIIPVYNDYDMLPGCMESIDRQTYLDHETIIVDDGSDEIFYTGDNLHRRAHRGAPAARNYGAGIANGEFLFFLDADVELFPMCLERMVNSLTDEYDWVYGDYLMGEELHQYQPFSVRRLQRRNLCSTMSLMRRESFTEWDESLERFQDWDLFLGMALDGKVGRYIPETLFRTAHREDGISYGTIPSGDAKQKILKKWQKKFI